jgi:hypothetical protein
MKYTDKCVFGKPRPLFYRLLATGQLLAAFTGDRASARAQNNPGRCSLPEKMAVQAEKA